MKILVTGGAGFIGSHVVDAYVDAGHDVVVIDDLSMGKEGNVNKNAVFYKVDITDVEALKNIFAKEKPEIVNHHAAQVDVDYSISHAKRDQEVNIAATIQILDLSVKYKIKRLIFASSAAVYGTHEPGERGLHEDLQPLPLSPYGISKCTAEEYITCYGHLFGLKYTIFRYPNVYGPRQKSGDGGVIAIFMKKMAKDEAVTIFGSGNQTRDFLYVGDAAQANVMALTINNDGNKFNIGTEKSTKINDLFLILKEKTNYNKKAIFGAERKGEVRHSRLDCTKARNELDWTARTSLREGLEKTYEEMKNAQ